MGDAGRAAGRRVETRFGKGLKQFAKDVIDLDLAKVLAQGVGEVGGEVVFAMNVSGF